jgi:ABC-type uncharacterized transport system substrate-binding protein
MPSSAQAPHKRVLILKSYGRDFGPYNEVSSRFETELAQLSPGTVEFYEASLETARFAENTNEAPLVGYLEALFAERPMDLLVSIGGPAARFCLRQRDNLYPSIPFLAAGVDERFVEEASNAGNATAAPVALDFPGVIENILRLLPDTKEIYVVLGDSPFSKLWVAETKREFQPFSDRVRFTWTNEWSLEEMKKRTADLPPGSVIFFGELSVDAAGVPHARHTALESLSAAANAPIFGLFDSQLGRGIVGGPLVPVSKAADQAAAAALRILNGEDPASVVIPAVTPTVLAYDVRELERWGIREAVLPTGARIAFRHRFRLG